MRHIYGRPYHQQTQGKIERFNRTIKDYIYVYSYNSPDELQKAIRQAVEWYNNRPHEALQNVSPNDVYAGRKEEILQRRAEKKKLTLERRKAYNLVKDSRGRGKMRTTENHQVETDSKLYNVLTTYSFPAPMPLTTAAQSQ
jgi:L-lactate utilization protein LutC